MNQHFSSERRGEFFILAQSALYGFFPVLLSYSGGKIPPLFFAAVSTLISFVVFLGYSIFKRTHHECFQTKALPHILRLVFFMVSGYCLLYIGGSQTSGINISILSQAEIVFTALFATLFFGERMSSKKALSGLMVLTGSLLIVYNGSFRFNPGDLLILCAVALFPFGNVNAQKAMTMVAPQTVLTVRAGLSGLLFLIISLTFEKSHPQWQELFSAYWPLFLVNGVGMFSLTKLMWYEGMKRLELTKAITIGMSFTAFGVVYSMFLLKEMPTLYQFLGFVAVMLGVLLITRKPLKAKLYESLEEI